jgi:hypothetical protein
MTVDFEQDEVFGWGRARLAAANRLHVMGFGGQRRSAPART